jgi:hypothetical protein
MTPADLGRKFGRAVMAWTDQYEAHPFAWTFHLLLLPLVWLVVVVGLVQLVAAWGGALSSDPAQSFADGVGTGLLIGSTATLAAVATRAVLNARRGRPQ